MLETIIKMILQASLTAGIAAAAVMLLRLPLKKAPKRWSYILWAVVFFRCLCPFSVESAVSIFNAVPEQEVIEQVSDSYEYITFDYDPVYVDYSGNADFNKPDTDEKTAVSKKSVSYNVLFIVWASGTLAMLLYAVISYIRLMSRMKTAIKAEDGIYETDRVSTAFSAGLFPPKIFLPCGLSENEKKLIIAHERVHIKRLDFVFKPLAFAGLALHWFNPMVWMSFALMTKDMELSCDEAVLKIMGTGEKKSYSNALLKVSMKRSGLTALPLAFAGSGIKERVKNVLSYRKPKLVAAIIAAVVVLTAGVVLGTDAVRNVSEDEEVFTETLITDYITKVENRNGDNIFIINPIGTEDNVDAGFRECAVYIEDTSMSVSSGSAGMRDIDIDNFDPDKVEKAVIHDLRIDHYDDYYGDGTNEAFTYIAIDMELYMTEDNDKAPVAEYSSEYVENNSVITKMCGGNEKQYGFYFEIEIPQNAYGNDTAGYGILFTGFRETEFYVRDNNLKIADFNFPVADVPLDDTFKVDQDASNWEKIAEKEQMRLEEEKRREEESAKQKRLEEEREAMEQEKAGLAESSVEVIIDNEDQDTDEVFLYYSFGDDDPMVSDYDEVYIEFPDPGIILRSPIEDPQNTCLNGIESYGMKDLGDGVEEFHKGIDFTVPEGTPVYAAADGKIINDKDKRNGYGLCVIVDHGGDLSTLYAHLSEVLVQEGDEVKAGDLIGYSGKTGAVYGATLHFEVRVNGQHTDPMAFLEKIE